MNLIPLESKVAKLNAQFKNASNTLSVCLFTSDVTPDVNDTFTTYIPSGTPTYFADFAVADWTVSTFNDAGTWKAKATSAEKQIVLNGAQGTTVYGQLIYDSNKKLIVIEKFDTPSAITFASERLDITVEIIEP